MKAIWHLIKLTLWLLVILTPLIGVWVASSLATYLNGPIWLTVLAGALLFPLLPLVWELWALRRWTKKQEGKPQPAKPRILTFGDRMIGRTLLINLLFLAGLLAYFPQQSFTALATRGDWMLQDSQTSKAQQARDLLFTSAGALEWLYKLSKDNPYEDMGGEPPPPPPKPQPTPKPKPKPQPEVKDGTKTKDDGKAPNKPNKPSPTSDGANALWPMSSKLHPLVANMPAEAETSYESVAKYIAQHEKDPVQRVKALHDWVADRIAYDGDSLYDGSYVYKQTLPKIWQSRRAVCAGYAKALVELGKHTGDEIVYLTGDSRDQDGSVGGNGHAWNAAKINDKWYLIDATWNSGYLKGKTFVKEYKTDYLFTPGEIFSLDHLPDDPAWQLRQQPLSTGEFMRQPMLRPSFYAAGLDLKSPTRSQVDAPNGKLDVVLENKQDRFVMVKVKPKGGGAARDCASSDHKTRFSCNIRSSGTYRVELYVAPKGKRYGSYDGVGKLEVTF